MSETERALDRITDRALEIGVAQVWDRIAPLSAGAVASSVVIVAGGAILRRGFKIGFKMVNGRSLRWIGLAAVVPLSLWLLTRPKERASPFADEAADAPLGSSEPAKLSKT